MTFLVFLYVLALCWEREEQNESSWGGLSRVWAWTESWWNRIWDKRITGSLRRKEGEMAWNSLDLLIFFWVSLCSEVERFWFVFIELCLGSYGEPMLMGLHCTVKLYVYPYPPIYLFIFVYIGFILYVIFVYIVLIYFFLFIMDANIFFFFTVYIHQFVHISL